MPLPWPEANREPADGQPSQTSGGVTFWWGEATDEPAREDARPTEAGKLYHH